MPVLSSLYVIKLLSYRRLPNAHNTKLGTGLRSHNASCVSLGESCRPNQRVEDLKRPAKTCCDPRQQGGSNFYSIKNVVFKISNNLNCNNLNLNWFLLVFPDQCVHTGTHAYTDRYTMYTMYSSIVCIVVYMYIHVHTHTYRQYDIPTINPTVK